MAAKAKAVGALRPASVKVLSSTFDVEWLDENEWLGRSYDPDAAGMTFNDRLTICIRAGSQMHEQNLRETLYHEITHVAWSQTDLGRTLDTSDDKDESCIAGLSPIMFAILQENPVTVAYIMDQS